MAELVGGELHGDNGIEINSVADIKSAVAGQIAFFEKAEALPDTAASCVFVSMSFSGAAPVTTIAVRDPKLAFAKVAAILHPPKPRDGYVHPNSETSKAGLGNNVFVGEFASIGEGSTIGDGSQILAGVRIGENVTVGSNCVFHPNVVLEDGCTIGDNVVLHGGVVIGSDGFGYVRESPATTAAGGEYIKFPQIGTVVIEDNVEIGANSCVDRGALGETRIGSGSKIDNLVQIGHNVQIGKRCVIAAQTGISGSTVIEDDCVIGGQVGFGDHVLVKSGAIIGSQAGVLPGKIVRPGIWWGTPIQPLNEYKRQNAHVKGLERLKAEVKDLARRLKDRS